jgi:ABC-type multidrug transport system ATPase subunit
VSDPTHPQPALSFDRVSAGYTTEKPVFTEVSFTLAGPELIHLTGRNGSGKSTFVELVSGHLRPWSGHVTVGGLPAGDPLARPGRRILRSEVALFGPMTVRDHVALACVARDIPPGPELARAESLGLGEWIGENAGNLSTGNARKLWFVMGTVGEFAVLVLDEPFSGVDVEGVERMAAQIRAWSRHALVVIVTHTLEGVFPGLRTVSLDRLKDGSGADAAASVSGSAYDGGLAS